MGVEVSGKSLTYCFDLDDTLCVTNGLDYSRSSPILERIEKVNRLYDAGCTIKIFTARGSETGIDWRDLTQGQLNMWGVKHHQLILGKPAADFYVDDKACRDVDFDWT
jgi:hypothetical protein